MIGCRRTVVHLQRSKTKFKISFVAVFFAFVSRVCFATTPVGEGKRKVLGKEEIRRQI